MMKKPSLLLQIVIALVLGVICGLILHNCTSVVDWISAGGSIFIGLIKCIAIPLVLFAIVAGIVNLRDLKKFRGIGIRTIIYYLGTTVIAVTIGLIVANLFSVFFPKMDILDAEYTAEPLSILDTFVNMFPNNIVQAFSNDSMIQIIVFAILFGIALLLIGKLADPTVQVVNSVNHALTKLLEMIMKLTPIGVFCLICPVVAYHGLDTLGSLVILVGVILFGYIIHMFVIYSIAVKTLGGLSPIKFFKGMVPAILMAFSSASSVATLPMTIKCCDKLQVKPEIQTFVLPLGATMNMDGTCICSAGYTIFIASCYGMQLTIYHMILAAIFISIASIGVAGVPGETIPVLTLVLAVLGLPMDGIALIVAVDRLLDMCRSTVNITGDASCAVVLSRYLEKKNAHNTDPSLQTH